MKKYLKLDYILAVLMILSCVGNLIISFDIGWICCLMWVLISTSKQFIIDSLEEQIKLIRKW